MICIENITKKKNTKKILNNFTLNVKQGETIAVTGASGCGKTTLLRLIAGLDILDKGQIRIDDQIVSSPLKTVPPNKRNLSLIFQDLALWPHMTVEEHLSFVLKKNKTDKWIAELLDHVHLDRYKNQYPHQLSGGEQQRLAIARGVATRPKYLLMDEPFSHLDKKLKNQLEFFILQMIKKLDISIVYVTHSIRDASKLADRIAFIEDGQILKINKTDNTRIRPSYAGEDI